MNVVRVLRSGFADATCRATYLDRLAQWVRSQLGHEGPIHQLRSTPPAPAAGRRMKLLLRRRDADTHAIRHTACVIRPHSRVSR
jgi:hypothetical protein